MALDLLRGRQVATNLTNTSGLDLKDGAFVIVDVNNPVSFTTTAVEGQTDYTVGILLENIDNGDDGRVLTSGYAPKVNLDSYADNQDYILTSSAHATGTISDFLRGGVYGRTLSSGTTPPALIGVTPSPNSITGTVAAAGHIIQEDGVNQTARDNLNFVGNFLDVFDDAGNNATVVNVTGTPGHIARNKAGTDLPQRKYLSVTGTTVEMYDDAGEDTTFIFVSGSAGGGGSGGLVQWSVVTGSSNSTYGVAAWADIPEMSITMTTDANAVELNFNGSFGNSSSGGIGQYRFTIDGVAVGRICTSRCPTATIGNDVGLSWIQEMSSAEHTFKVQWYALVGTIQGDASGGEGRTLTAKEFLEVT